jgi:hypothetical protein
MGSSKFINQEIQMYFIVSVDYNCTIFHITRSDSRVLRSAVYPVQWMGLICCGITVKRMGMLEVSVRKIMALIVMLHVTF